MNESEFGEYLKCLNISADNLTTQMIAFQRVTGNTLIVTLGAQSAIAISRDGFQRVSAPASRPIDTVGAGDTFCGFLAGAISANSTLDVALNQAVVAGSLACLKRGAQTAMPLAHEVHGVADRLACGGFV